jgi:hypothetical protein
MIDERGGKFTLRSTGEGDAAILLVVLGIGGAIAGGAGLSLTVLMIVVLGPIAFYRKFINKKTRTVGNRPYVPGQDCPDCAGWGTRTGESGPCPSCGGRRTR